MKNLLVAMLVVMAVAACKKDPDVIIQPPPCETGDIRMVNNSTNPYFIYLDGVFKTTVNGQSTFLLTEVPEGNRRIKAEQKSGYIFTPTVVEKTIAVFGCQTEEFFFP